MSESKTVQEQLESIKLDISNHESMIKLCQDKIELLRATMKTSREVIKRLKKKKRDLIFSTVGI